MTLPVALGAGALAGSLLGLGQLPTITFEPIAPVEVPAVPVVEYVVPSVPAFTPVPFEGDLGPIEVCREWQGHAVCGGAE